MIFVIDLDDTVCDTNDYSVQYIKNFIKKNNLPYKQISTTSRFAERQFDWPMDVALNWYKTYGDDMMLEFPAKNGAIETINKLHNEGHTIVIATARANDWHTDPEGLTKTWLKTNDLHYDKLYCGRIDKEKICEEVDADIFIDDDLKITENVLKHFTDSKKDYAKVFLMNSNYNKDFETSNEIIRVSNFNEIYNLIKNNMDTKTKSRK